MLIATGLPVVPVSPCPGAAAAVGAGALGALCQGATGPAGVAGLAGSAVSGVAGLTGSAASQVTGFGVDSVLNALGSWVSAGATWLLAQIGTVMSDTTGIDLGASWFTAHYGTMAALAAVVVVPLMLLGIMQSVYRQNASMLVRSVVVNVPLAILLTAVAVKLVQLGLSVTDAMSAAVANGAGLDSGHFLGTVTAGLTGAAVVGQPAVPAFVLFIGGIAVVFGALAVWIELLIRSAAVYVAVLFLPLALASLAWPAISHWCRRLVDTLVALILGKFVIVSVLSLAAGALAGGTGAAAPAGGAGSSGTAAPTAGGGFAAVLGGAALLLLAAFSPWALFRLLPFLEAGAVGHLEGLSQRAHQSVGAPVKGLAMTAMRASVAGSAIGPLAAAAGVSASAGTGSLGGRPAGGHSRPGTTASGAGGGGPRGHGDHGGRIPDGDSGFPDSSESGPELEPSTAATTGVGTMEPPGHGIPAWPVHPEATAAANRAIEELQNRAVESHASVVPAVDPATGPPGGPAMAGGSEAPPTLDPLPRQSGAVYPDALGRDDLGVRLVSGPRPPSVSQVQPLPLPRERHPQLTQPPDPPPPAASPLPPGS